MPLRIEFHFNTACVLVEEILNGLVDWIHRTRLHLAEIPDGCPRIGDFECYLFFIGHGRIVVRRRKMRLRLPPDTGILLSA